MEAVTPLLPEIADSFFWKAGKNGCLLIHGYTGTPWSLRYLGETLFEKKITVMAPLLPGHGTSPDDLANTKYGAWVDSVFKAYVSLKNECDRIFVAGLSMGGALAAELAAKREVDGLILLSAAFRLRRIENLGVSFLKPFIKYKMKRNIELEQGFLTSEMGYNCYPVRGTAEVIKMLREIRRNLSDVRCPVLVMHSKCDKKIPVWNAERYVAHLGSTEKKLRILDDSCHVITRGDDREMLAKEIYAFIQQNSES